VDYYSFLISVDNVNTTDRGITEFPLEIIVDLKKVTLEDVCYHVTLSATET